MGSGRATSAASSSPPTAARRGTACCSATTRPAPSTRRSIRTTRDVLYAALWEVAARRAHVERRPGSGLFKSTDGGDTWTELTQEPRPAQRRSGARSASSVSGADSQPRLRDRRSRPRAASSSRTTPARPGRDRTTTATCASARSTTRASTPTRKAKDTVYVLNVGFYRVDRRRQDVHDASACRTATTTTCGSRPNDPQAHDQGQRRRRQRLDQRRRDLDRPGLSRPRSSTTSSRPTHVPYHVCGAQQDNSHGVRVSQPTGGGGSAARSVYAVGGGESGYIAPDPRDPDVFYAGSYGGLLTRLNRRTGQQRDDQHLARQSDGLRVGRHHRALPVDVPDRLLADRSERRSTRRRSTSGSRPTRARAGSAISPDLTRHDPKTMGAIRRSDHQGQHRRRDLRDDLHARAVAAGRQRDLGRLRRRLRARHARRRQELDERHADGPAASSRASA